MQGIISKVCRKVTGVACLLRAALNRDQYAILPNGLDMEIGAIIQHQAILIRIIDEMVSYCVEDVGPDSNLIEDVGLNSIQMIQLVSKVEERFHIRFEDSHLTLDHFESVRAISELICLEKGCF